MIRTSQPFIVPKAPEILYRANLYKLIRAMIKDYKSLLGIYREKQDQVAMDATGSWLTTDITARLDELGAKWSKRFEEFAKDHSKKFVNKMLRLSNTQIKSILKDWFADKRLELIGQVIPNEVKQVVNADIVYNVSLIKSIQSRYHDRVLGAVMRSVTNGGSLKQLTIEVARYGNMEYREAKNIALDQTRKVYTSITMRNCQRLGIQKMKWMHSHARKEPRPLHIRKFNGDYSNYPHVNGLDGLIFDINNPPVIQEAYTTRSGKQYKEITGYPTQLPFCGCVMVAVME